jgi:hypothetical protein
MRVAEQFSCKKERKKERSLTSFSHGVMQAAAM